MPDGDKPCEEKCKENHTHVAKDSKDGCKDGGTCKDSGHGHSH